jgi:membrane protein
MLKDAGVGFSRHKIPKLSASLCFFSLISLGPMLMIIVFVSGLFWGKQASEGTLTTQFAGLLGSKAAGQIQELIKHASFNNNSFMVIVSFVVLFFAATTVFNDIHDSINTIWNLKVRKGRGFIQMLRIRLVSFLIISGLGLLLLLFLIFNEVAAGFRDSLREMFPSKSFSLLYVVNVIGILFVVSLLFAFIFKLLPDAHIRWKHVIPGAVFTAVLFMVGKSGLTFYLNHTHLGNAYGSASSLVVLILWIYYSALVLYFGAEFTKVHALRTSDDIKPKDFAVTIKVSQVETNASSIQKNERENGE